MSTKNKIFIGIIIGIFVIAAVVLVLALIYGPGQQNTLMGVCVDSGWADDTSEVEVLGANDCPTPQWDSDFPLVLSHRPYADEEQDVEAAVDAINTAMGREVFVIGTGIAQVEVITNAPYENGEGQGLRDGGGDAALLMERGRVHQCVIHTRASGDAGIEHDVLRHELGHCLLLAHDPEDEGSIMHTVQGKTWNLVDRRRLRDTDRAALREHHGL